MELMLTHYAKDKTIGLDWTDGRPAAERVFKDEQEAREWATRYFVGYPITRVREWA